MGFVLGIGLGFIAAFMIIVPAFHDTLIENCSAQYNSTTGEFEIINMCEINEDNP